VAGPILKKSADRIIQLRAMSNILRWVYKPKKEFLLSVPDGGEKLKAELLVQEADSERIFGDFRISIGGSEAVNVSFSTDQVYSSELIPSTKLSFDIWPRDIKIRRNSTTSPWFDLNVLIKAREVLVDLLEVLTTIPGNEGWASIRWAIEAVNSGDLELVLQSLPATANTLNSHTVFNG